MLVTSALAQACPFQSIGSTAEYPDEASEESTGQSSRGTLQCRSKVLGPHLVGNPVYIQPVSESKVARKIVVHFISEEDGLTLCAGDIPLWPEGPPKNHDILRRYCRIADPSYLRLHQANS